MKAVALDFGHTIIDERVDFLAQGYTYDESHLMPGARHALEGLTLPVAVWANTRITRESDIWQWLDRTALSKYVRWVATSVDGGARKPEPGFFRFAPGTMALAAGDVLFVGNQLNTDIAGARGYGIRSEYLSGDAYRSADDRPVSAVASHTIPSLRELPSLVEQLGRT
jgi:putative hydrolase of the HAD superfamily